MIHAKLFCFPYHDQGFGTIQVNAIAYLYPDGSLKDIEIEHAYFGDMDVLQTCNEMANMPNYVRAWKERFYSEAKRLGALHIQCVIANSYLFEYEYNN